MSDTLTFHRRTFAEGEKLIAEVTCNLDGEEHGYQIQVIDHPNKETRNRMIDVTYQIIEHSLRHWLGKKDGT